jgi:hypothetical protein
MAHKKAISDGEASKINLKNFDSWLSSNKKMIKATPGKSVVYAGGKYDIGWLEKAKGSDEKIIRSTRMYEHIANLNKENTDKKLPVKFETLEDVLTQTKSHPTFIDRDGVEKSFAHMFEYMECLKEFPKLFPQPTIKKCWQKLSALYASNAEGDLKFFDGVDQDYRKIETDRILLNTELEKLLQNKELSDETKAMLSEKLGKYLKYLESDTKKRIKKLLNEKKLFNKSIKTAKKLA